MTRDVLPPEPPFPPTASNLDCRRRPAYDEATEMIAGAEWRDPETILSWLLDVPRDRPVVVYCKYGHEVSLFVASTLRVRGYDVRSLGGGIAAWIKAGGAIQDKP